MRQVHEKKKKQHIIVDADVGTMIHLIATARGVSAAEICRQHMFEQLKAELREALISSKLLESDSQKQQPA
jgi:hypothetical protein